MLKTLIIEDEKPAARRLSRMLLKLKITPLAMLHSVSESILWLEKNPTPDLILLDIHLSDGLSFEIFENIDIKSALIFTTAFDNYTLKAFKLNSVDYLLKPIDADELEKAINKYRLRQEDKKTAPYTIDSIKALIKKNNTSYKQRFVSHSGQHIRIVETQKIACFLSEEKATYAYYQTGKSFLLEESLEKVIPQLNPKEFFRVNRQFIINIAAIKDIISYANSRLQIKVNGYTEKPIIVSREKVSYFKKWL